MAPCIFYYEKEEGTMKIGIDLGGSHINIGLVNENNEIIDSIDYVWSSEEKKNIYITMQTYCLELIETICEKNNFEVSNIESVGIGFPYRNIKKGIIYVEGKPINIPAKITEKYGIPAYLKNDVKVSSMCEKTIGSLKEYPNALFLTLGTGIGGAYYYQNELMKPSVYQGLEIGHMIIQAGGKVCRCGQKGCFEEYASMRAFRNKIRETYHLENINSDIVLDLYDKKKKIEEMNQIIEEYTDYLAIGIGNLIHIFEPDAICFGGSFVHYERLFMKKIEKKLKARFPGREIPKLLLAKYGNDAGIIGAAMLTSN